MLSPRVPRGLSILVTAAVLAAGCSDDGTSEATDDVVANTAAVADEPADDAATEPEPAADDGTTDDDADGVIGLTVEATTASVLAARVTIDSPLPIRAKIIATAGDHEVSTPFTAATATNHELPLVGMRPEREYTIGVVIEDPEGAERAPSVSATFATGALPDFIPDYEFTADASRTADGVTLIEVIPFQTPEPVSPSMIALDDDGEVVWYHSWAATLGGIVQTEAGTFIGHNYPFSVVEFDVLGQTARRWQVATPDDVVIDDESAVNSLNAVVGLPGDPDPLFADAAWTNLGAFHHESFYLDNGNVLFLSTTVHELTPEQRATLCPGDPLEFNAITDLAVEMMPSGEVVRTWDLWDVLDIDQTPGSDMCLSGGIYADTLERDWTHANSVVYDPDRDAVIISSRHTDQIVAMDYGDAPGPQTELRWILGTDGTLPLDGLMPYHTHAVEVLDDGSIIVYDNGNGRPGTEPGDPASPTYSRAVIYEIDDRSDDPADWSATQVWEHLVEGDDGLPLYAFFVGDADMLANGNVLINHGGIGAGFGTAGEARIIEVVPDDVSGGDIVMDFRMGAVGDGRISYRSERLESFFVGPLWES